MKRMDRVLRLANSKKKLFLALFLVSVTIGLFYPVILSAAGRSGVVSGKKVTSTPHIVSTSPSQNQLNVVASTNISVTFDVDMNSSTIDSSTFIVNARSTGRHQGTITYDGITETATLDPTEDFAPGEVVTVVLTTGIQSSEGTPLQKTYSWSFTVLAINGTGTFAPHVDYPVGDGCPYSVFAGDLDSDGDLDLATANPWGGTVSVLLNNGDATFSPSADYPAGAYPNFVFAADLDSDGDLDLATANPNIGIVSVLLNNGNATFNPHTEYPVSGNPWSVFAADLDADGDLDLATANGASNTVSVLLNNGDATFSPHTDYPVGGTSYSIFAADLDGDGDLDLVTANYQSHNVSVLLNNGNATFSSSTEYPVISGAAGSIFAADLDADGDIDLATANHAGNTVSVLLNNGNATFSPSTEYPVGGNNPHYIFAADLDGDGDIDLATANYESHNVSVLLNNGDATFSSSTEYPVGSSPSSVLAADLDADGDLDLATANRSGTVSVLINLLKDIAVINVVTSKTVVIQGNSVSIDVTVRNQGNVTETFDVTTYYNDIPIQTKTVTGLAPDQETTISFDWNTTGIAIGDYTISAYAHPLLGETETDDNTYIDGTVSIIHSCGDCNGDGQVGLADVVYLINYLFKGGPAPVPVVCVADVNADGQVGLVDVVYLINYVLKGGPPPGVCCQ